MPNSIFPEKRTRSQITLPDDILKVPTKSPLKDARSALRNNHAASGSSRESNSPADDSEDELLLSPRKRDSTPKPPSSHSFSKRSVSPPPGGEYPKEGLPQEGRELKRLKRDLEINGSLDADMKLGGRSQHAIPLHTRTNSEPIGKAVRRSTRRRAGTTSRKPFSEAGSSPPPSELSPASSIKGRAQSVPLQLPSSYPMPRIDLAHPPSSPKRSRTRSRSPSKEREPKLRLMSGCMKSVEVLSSIPDEAGTLMEVDAGLTGAQGSREEEVVTDGCAKAEEPVIDDITEKDNTRVEAIESEPLNREVVGGQEMKADPKNDDVTSKCVETAVVHGRFREEETLKDADIQGGVVDSLAKQDTVKPAGIEEVGTSEKIPGNEASSEASSMSDPPILAAGESSRDSEFHPVPDTWKHEDPYPSSVAIVRPTTPVAAQQDISFTSPLTPIPDTPQTDASTADNRYASSSGWGMASEIHDDEPALFLGIEPMATLRKSESKSRLPRLSLVPSTTTGDSKGKKASEMGPPVTLTSKTRPLAPSKLSISVAGNKSATSGATNAFSLMMKKSNTGTTPGTKGQGKEAPRLLKPTGPLNKPGSSSLFPSSSGKSKLKQEEQVPIGSRKPTIKGKMRPREKPPKPRVNAVPIPLPDTVRGNSDHEAVREDLERSTGDAKLTDEISLSKPQEPASKPDVPTAPASPLYGDGDLSMQDITGTSDSQSAADVGSSNLSKEVERSSAIASAIPAFLREPEKLPSEIDNPMTAPLPDPIPKQSTAQTPSEPISNLIPARSTQEVHNSGIGSTTDSIPLALPSKSKLPLVKKRTPIAVPPASRVTRSVSSRQQTSPVEVSQVVEKSSLRTRPISKAPAPSNSIGVNTSQVINPTQPTSNLPKAPVDIKGEPSLPPGSPMRMSSPEKQPKTTPKLNEIAVPSPASSPSPFKLSRSASLFSVRGERRKSMSIDFGHGQSNAGGSSLSTLSNALEKLRMPAPPRPSTSMGFNRDFEADNDDDRDVPMRSMDDGAISQKSLGLGNPVSTSLKRASTVGPLDLGAKPSSKGAAAAGNKALVQHPLPSLLAGKSGASISKDLQSGTGAIMRARKLGADGNDRPKPRIFGVGGGGLFGTGARRTAPKASRIPTLPSVMGSPVKGDDRATVPRATAEDDGITSKLDDSGSIFTDNSEALFDQDSSDFSHILAGGSDKGKGKATADIWKKDASRRASMASHLLTQSLSSIPPAEPSSRSLMGPPATPSRGGMRSSSSTYPSSTSPTRNTAATRSSTRLANTAPSALGKTKSGANDHISSNRKRTKDATPEGSSKPVPETLRILKDCVIFVDIRTDEGEEAGSLFAEMLEGVGARVLTRVGQTCTHIVYKNGLTSTLNRYRLLREPKPFVVGIAWVVDCVEQRKRVDEAKYLIDLDDVNVAGTNKRRRSMLPKLISRDFSADAGSSDVERDQSEDLDNSLDESNSSISMDDHLPPLERARRRKSMLVGPR